MFLVLVKSRNNITTTVSDNKKKNTAYDVEDCTVPVLCYESAAGRNRWRGTCGHCRWKQGSMIEIEHGGGTRAN